MFEPFDFAWHEVTAWMALLNIVLTVSIIVWVLAIKKDTTSALAWCLLVLFVPVLGALSFVLLGWQQVHRPVLRKARHKKQYRTRQLPVAGGSVLEAVPGELVGPQNLAELAQRFDAYPPTAGNDITFYYDGASAYEAKLEAIRAARHHIHLEYFIFQPDESGDRFLTALTDKARQGVEVRLLYDAMGSHRLHRWKLRQLRSAGGKCFSFLPLDPLRRRVQINMRNHRKILVVDGETAFTGGLNIGDEYLGKVPRYGYWRDTHLRVVGPLVADLQRVFIEDWDFAAREQLSGGAYLPAPSIHPRNQTAQIIHSGPDQELKSIREIYFAAILRARQRLWIASPYFVPDAGLRDALCLAGWQGVDVRLVGLFRPDKWIPYYAGRFYWTDMLAAGVKVYQYTRGMMHSKVMLVDGHWGSVGTANLDNRSLHLNFEVNCLLYSPDAIAELEEAFRNDLADSIQLQASVYAQRPFASRLIENGCRLMSPVL